MYIPGWAFLLVFFSGHWKGRFLTPPEFDQSRGSSLWVPYVTLLRGFGRFWGRIGLEKEVSEVSDDFDLLIELIAHALADKETSMLRVAHDQAVARQRQKLTAD